MPRATMPLFLALVGMLAAAGLAMSRYTDLMAGASADTEIYNLIAGAAGAPLEGDGVRTGTSSLPFVPVAPTDTTAEPVARDTIATQPREWVAAAARADREALAGWLGPLVMASAGPRSADTLFHPAARAGYDAVVAMYHDQALIPVKTLAFDEGVNVTLGLPFVRTSPDHGTAFDIAPRFSANPSSLIAALKLADEMSARRQRTGA